MRRLLLERRIDMLQLLPATACLLLFIAPFSGISQGPLELDAHGQLVPATLPHMYRYAFRIQNSMEGLAEDREKQGAPGAPIRESLRLQLGMSEPEFSLFESAAVDFGRREQQIEERVHDSAQADISKHPNTRTLSSEGRKNVHLIEAEAETMLNDELSALHDGLGSEASERLDAAITRYYTQGQRNAIPVPKRGDSNKSVPGTH